MSPAGFSSPTAFDVTIQQMRDPAGPEMTPLRLRNTIIAVLMIRLFSGECLRADDSEQNTPSDSETATAPAPIIIDGAFEDWRGIPTYTDPAGDTHTTTPYRPRRRPPAVEHPDVDLLEYRVTHDDESFYFYMRSRGRIGHTQKEAGKAQRAGRFYVNVTIDVDQNNETGYALRGGGYYPDSRGYDTNAELEFYNGQLNVAKYLNHGVRSKRAMHQAFLDQSAGQFRKGTSGPYPAGFMRLGPNHYDNYTEWVYHDNDTITFVHDKGPVVGTGIASYALSEDAHEIEMRFPFRGFLTSKDGQPIISTGSVLDLSFSLEASGESVPSKQWASDTGPPIQKYVLTPSATPRGPSAAPETGGS